MELTAKYGRIEIWKADDEFYVYGILSDPIVCPSLGKARETVREALPGPRDYTVSAIQDWAGLNRVQP